jgi:hypothetical protein
MRATSKKWLLIILLFAVTSLVALFAMSSYQSFRIHKIDFIIVDNQHDNVAGLTKSQLTDYLHACEANLDTSASNWVVRYDGFFQHQSWTFPYAAPKTTAPQ